RSTVSAGRCTLYPSVRITSSSRARTVGYDMPRTRSTSRMLPRETRNTSTNSRCSGVIRQKAHTSNSPSSVEPHERQVSLVTRNSPSHTGQVPTNRLAAIRTPPLAGTVTICHTLYPDDATKSIYRFNIFKVEMKNVDV